MDFLGKIESEFEGAKSELAQAVAQGDDLEIKIACYHYSEQYDRLACMRRIMRNGYRRIVLRLLYSVFGKNALRKDTLSTVADWDWRVTRNDTPPKSECTCFWSLYGVRIWGRVV